jgi:hypothetical protein
MLPNLTVTSFLLPNWEHKQKHYRVIVFWTFNNISNNGETPTVRIWFFVPALLAPVIGLLIKRWRQRSPLAPVWFVNDNLKKNDFHFFLNESRKPLSNENSTLENRVAVRA